MLVDGNFKFDENGRKYSIRVENSVGKGEIARYEQFFLFPHCFKRRILQTRNNQDWFGKINFILLMVTRLVQLFSLQYHPIKLAIIKNVYWIWSAQCRNRDDSGIVLRKVGIPTLSADSGIVQDNSRIAQGIHVLWWADNYGLCAK